PWRRRRGRNPCNTPDCICASPTASGNGRGICKEATPGRPQAEGGWPPRAPPVGIRPRQHRTPVRTSWRHPTRPVRPRQLVVVASLTVDLLEPVGMEQFQTPWQVTPGIATAFTKSVAVLARLWPRWLATDQQRGTESITFTAPDRCPSRCWL